MGSGGRLVAGIDPFALFCAYHLGLTEDGDVRVLNIHQVARRFRVGADVVREALARYDITAERVVECGFDVASAQADLAVAPPDADRQGMAREAYARFLEARKGGRRDWKKELAEDAAFVAEDPYFRK